MAPCSLLIWKNVIYILIFKDEMLTVAGKLKVLMCTLSKVDAQA